ncbi:MAG TPA: hypothetical protein VGE45_00400 [Chloroflexia bacterium]|jgi:hypothetical protein
MDLGKLIDQIGSGTFEPKVVELINGLTFVVVSLRVNKCPTCGKLMIFIGNWSDSHLLRQLTQAGIMKETLWTYRNRNICEECFAAGKAGFKCFLCEKDRTSDEEKESWGDPPEYLCTMCFETGTAKAWAEAQKKLYERHKHDHE